MARIEVFNREIIMNKSVEYIRKYGISMFNVRSLASFIGCSTQPLFRNFENINEFKIDLKKYLHKDYENFISKYVDKDDYLYTISYAYALYGKENPNIFNALFITDLAGSRTVSEVVNSSWNRETITCMTKQYNISLEDAEKVYRDVRFYTHGIGAQLCCKSIKLSNDELGNLIRNMINMRVNFIRGD